MKQAIRTIFICLAVIVAASCSSRDPLSPYDDEGNSYVKYELSVSGILLKYYNVHVECKSLGDSYMVTPVRETEPKAMIYVKRGEDLGTIKPSLKVYASRNNTKIDLDDNKTYTISNAYRVTSYSPSMQTRVVSDTISKVYTGAALKAYIAENTFPDILSYEF